MAYVTFAEFYTSRLYRLTALPQGVLPEADKELVRKSIFEAYASLAEEVGIEEATRVLRYAKKRAEGVFYAGAY